MRLTTRSVRLVVHVMLILLGVGLELNRALETQLRPTSGAIVALHLLWAIRSNR